MKILLSLLLFTVFASNIYGEKTSINYPNEVAFLNGLARDGTLINGVLQLEEDGFLDDGSIGFVYAGKFISNYQNHSVAIKFVSDAKSAQSLTELKMFSYLYAYQRPEVEYYGIPNIYYFGQWQGYTVTALTKLDTDLLHLGNKKNLLRNPLDVLILMRNFIIQLKYIHRCGIRHNDIKPGNLMVRGHQTFLIDFNMGSKMLEENVGCTVEYAARRFKHKQTRLPIDDFESLFYTICHFLRVPFPWFNPSLFQKSFKERFQMTCAFKQQTKKIRDCINNSITNQVLNRVINEFANEIYNDYESKVFPNYNDLYNLVNGEIIKLHAKSKSELPPMFSWLTETEQYNAINAQSAHVDITDIDEPSFINFSTFSYPNV